MRISANVQYGTETIQTFRLANVGKLNMYRKHDTKCAAVAKIQDKKVAKL
jgi:hypothetical protein